MITLNVNVKAIEFGNRDVGTGAGISKDGIGLIRFTDLSKSYKIGDNVPKEEDENAIVTLAFKKIESIDVVINALKEVKRLMQKGK